MVRSVARFAAVICGGRVAGIEGLLRLRRLVGDQVDLTLLSPAEYLSYRPLAVLEPFAAGAALRYSIPRIATDDGARLVRDTGCAKQVGASLEIVITIPGPLPLHAFGGDAGDAISRPLRDDGITVHTSAAGQVVEPHHVVLRPSGVHLHSERIETLPTISGPNVRGIPGDARNRFLPIDGHCRVPGSDGRVFAAGDATDLLVKQAASALSKPTQPPQASPIWRVSRSLRRRGCTSGRHGRWMTR
jgi:hypothetical protein